MSGLKYLLDTNFILGMMKSESAVLDALALNDILVDACAYSAVTRMELLGFPGISSEEEALVRVRLAQMTYVPITVPIEDAAIRLRRLRKIKLPDALIAATALHHELELLTLDSALQEIVSRAGAATQRFPRG